MTDKTEAFTPAAVDEIPPPPPHWLNTAGMWALVLGVAGLAIGYLMPHDLPASAGYLESRDAERNVAISLLLMWAGEKLLAAGFFMWLAGRVIDAFRHPKFY
jgi:hypothetical protein